MLILTYVRSRILDLTQNTTEKEYVISENNVFYAIWVILVVYIWLITIEISKYN